MKRFAAAVSLVFCLCAAGACSPWRQSAPRPVRRRGLQHFADPARGPLGKGPGPAENLFAQMHRPPQPAGGFLPVADEVYWNSR
jgi:hypothetical protein